MIIDGKKIAEDMYCAIEHALEVGSTRPHLTVFTAVPNFETKKFLGVKKRIAERLGIGLSIVEFPFDIDTASCVTSIERSVGETDGIIVQLPFPAHIDRTTLLESIPNSHDVDAFIFSNEQVLPPVVGAIAEIVKTYEIVVAEKKCVVVGNGRLVGAPASEWMRKRGADVTVLEKEDADIETYTKEADIIVLGAGVPGLLQKDMIQEGVVIFDAGTSEAEGKLTGDADPSCSEVASFFTPVPGGIGPITVAVLFRNLLLLSEKKGGTSHSMVV